MKKRIALLLCTLGLFASRAAISQEVIYLLDGTSHPYRLLEGDENVLKMAETKGTRIIKRSLPRADLAFIFNDKGAYLLSSEISSDPDESQTQLQLFYDTPPLVSGDLLIKKDPVEIISGTIQYESPEVVNYQTTSGISGSVRKNDLVAIVRSDGQHQLLAPTDEVALALTDALAELNKPASSSSNLADPPAKATTGTGRKTSESTQTASASLDEATLLGFRDKGLQKVEEFVQYLNIVSDKQVPSEEKDKAIEQTLLLFLPNATIEVTSANRPGSRTYKIRDYLIRLKLLPYSATEIAWHEVNYIQELTQESDGAYYGMISGVQTFTGYGDSGENIAYSDMTKKEVRVKLQKYTKNVEGAGQLNWEVLLGNIGISVSQ